MNLEMKLVREDYIFFALLLSLVLNVVAVTFWYNSNQAIQDIKGDAINLYASELRWKNEVLKTALERYPEDTNIIGALGPIIGSTAVINSLGVHINAPKELKDFLSQIGTPIIHTVYFNAIKDELTSGDIERLRDYVATLTLITEKLDNDFNKASSSEKYKMLDSIAKSIGEISYGVPDFYK